MAGFRNSPEIPNGTFKINDILAMIHLDGGMYLLKHRSGGRVMYPGM
jgi:hypothetical protein